ncbi:hypothetical protein DPMN_165640 [Dreissena polymorpha]|uniref:Uncharacterized protein n=1 Tax=Dreissena polymorpha TaxID=45954 RepID=A0A9D4EX87_DREPO|nr:hypothetical protein DPMN_165640 [Dreissena polymorpha]
MTREGVEGGTFRRIGDDGVPMYDYPAGPGYDNPAYTGHGRQYRGASKLNQGELN